MFQKETIEAIPQQTGFPIYRIKYVEGKARMCHDLETIILTNGLIEGISYRFTKDGTLVISTSSILPDDRIRIRMVIVEPGWNLYYDPNANIFFEEEVK